MTPREEIIEILKNLIAMVTILFLFGLTNLILAAYYSFLAFMLTDILHGNSTVALILLI